MPQTQFLSEQNQLKMWLFYYYGEKTLEQQVAAFGLGSVGLWRLCSALHTSNVQYSGGRGGFRRFNFQTFLQGGF